MEHHHEIRDQSPDQKTVSVEVFTLLYFTAVGEGSFSLGNCTKQASPPGQLGLHYLLCLQALFVTAWRLHF